jgi:TPR repeat protein
MIIQTPPRGERCAPARRVFACLAVLATLGAAPTFPATDAGLADFRQGRFAEALHNWQQAAASGDARAALYVGVLYDSGLGVVQDQAQALDWYRQAADAGSAAGAFNVGVLYDSGQGVAQDPKEAASWYARAAARGFARAQYNLGLMYETGSGVARNTARAIALYTSAARQGITAARIHLTALGHPFTGAERKPADPAMQDFQRAQQLLLSRGPAEAGEMAALFRRSADQHNALAEYDLAYCYEHGMGVGADRAQAAAWYSRAEIDAPEGTLRAISKAAAGRAQMATGSR